jgi:stage II sporulation protein D
LLLKKVLPSLAAVVVLVLGATPSHAVVPVPVLVVDGQGFGHGVGMAQDGAYWMGRGGASLDQILGQFYPGATIGRASGPVRVVVLTDADRDTVVTFPDGGQVRSPRSGPQAAGFPLDVAPGGAVRIRHDGRYHVAPVGAIQARAASRAQLLPLPQPKPRPPSSTTTTTFFLHPPAAPTPPPTTPATTTPTTAPTTTTTSPERTSSGAVWAVPAANGTIGVPDRGARYRGDVQAAAGGDGLRLIDELDVEQYLRGMGEVRDPSWPLASLEAQAVAARTYALRAMRASGEICDTQRCQVYLGQQAEYAAMDRAVAATAGQVLTYGGTFAAAVYSANGGGISASPQEGFGTPDSAYPYLRAAAYTTKSPDPWEVKIALADLAGRLGYGGELTSVRVASTGPSGRPTAVALDGSAGTRTVPAMAVARALGLRSTKWAVRVQLGDAPPPPPAEDRIQELPDEAAQATSAGGRAVAKDVAPLTRRASHDDGPPGWAVPALLVLVLGAGALGFRTLRREGRTSPPDEP